MATANTRGTAPIPPAPLSLPPPPTEVFRQTLTAAAIQLEASRCHETELQAWEAFTASQLRNNNNSNNGSGTGVGFMVETVTTTGEALLPGGCVDAWNALAGAAMAHRDDEAAETDRSRSVQQQQLHEDSSMTCTCGSTKVEVLSSNTNKSQDMTKAETWGNKDRHDEIIHRYLRHHCGKTWNDVE